MINKRAKTLPDNAGIAQKDSTPFKWPLNAYMLYFYDAIVSGIYNEKSVIEAVRMVASDWEELCEDEKQMYTERAERAVTSHVLQ